MLNGLGDHADAVDNGIEAVIILAQKSYDLVLMACQMPERDRRRVQAANSTALNQSIPLRVVTADMLKGVRERCLAAGRDEYLTKPIHSGFLAHGLSRRLRANSGSVAQPVVIEWDRFVARVGGDVLLARELLDEFNADYSQHLNHVTQAGTENRHDDAKQALGALRKTASDFFASALARAIGKAARDLPPECAPIPILETPPHEVEFLQSNLARATPAPDRDPA